MSEVTNVCVLPQFSFPGKQSAGDVGDPTSIQVELYYVKTFQALLKITPEQPLP